MKAFSRSRERLADCFRVPTPAWEIVRFAADKRLTYELPSHGISLLPL